MVVVVGEEEEVEVEEALIHHLLQAVEVVLRLVASAVWVVGASQASRVHSMQYPGEAQQKGQKE